MIKKAEQKIKIKPKAVEFSKRVYSNYVQISKNPLEVSMKFCDVAPLLPEDMEVQLKVGEVSAPIVAEIVLPRPVADELLRALETVLRKEDEK